MTFGVYFYIIMFNKTNIQDYINLILLKLRYLY